MGTPQGLSMPQWAKTQAYFAPTDLGIAGAIPLPADEYEWEPPDEDGWSDLNRRANAVLMRPTPEPQATPPEPMRTRA